MKKLLLCTLFFFSLSALAKSSKHVSIGEEWQLKSPMPTQINIPATQLPQKLIIHVNKYLKENPSVRTDTIELICGAHALNLSAGMTSTCALPAGINGIIRIQSANFHYGSEGTYLLLM